MITIVSKRHKVKFYWVLFPITLLYFILGTALLYYFLNTIEEAGRSAEYPAVIFSLVFYSMAIYSIYVYYKNVPIIQINSSQISFNNQTYALDDIEHLELTGTGDFSEYSLEAATLKFRDGRIRCVFDDMYENSWELKSFLKQVVVDKQSYIKSEPRLVGNREPKDETFGIYSGNPVFSYRGFFFWMPIGFTMVAWASDSIVVPIPYSIIFTVMIFLWCLLYAWQMHFFKVSPNYFVVRNHYLFWKKKVFKLSDIQEVAMNSRHQLPNGVRVITKDFKNRRYWGGTLSDNTWFQLRDQLERYSIRVRYEL